MTSTMTTDGTFTAQTIDMVNYPPGSYTVEIRGTVGTNSAVATFVATFVDPCYTTNLSIVVDPFVDKLYKLRDPKILQPFVT